MVHKGLEKSLKNFDSDLNALVGRFEDNPIETRKTPGVISKKISKKSKGYDVKGFLKWLFTEFF
jgi:hypothetical protein